MPGSCHRANMPATCRSVRALDGSPSWIEMYLLQVIRGRYHLLSFRKTPGISHPAPKPPHRDPFEKVLNIFFSLNHRKQVPQISKTRVRTGGRTQPTDHPERMLGSNR